MRDVFRSDFGFVDVEPQQRRQRHVVYISVTMIYFTACAAFLPTITLRLSVLFMQHNCSIQVRNAAESPKLRLLAQFWTVGVCMYVRVCVSLESDSCSQCTLCLTPSNQYQGESVRLLVTLHTRSVFSLEDGSPVHEGRYSQHFHAKDTLLPTGSSSKACLANLKLCAHVFDPWTERRVLPLFRTLSQCQA